MAPAARLLPESEAVFIQEKVQRRDWGSGFKS